MLKLLYYIIALSSFWINYNIVVANNDSNCTIKGGNFKQSFGFDTSVVKINSFIIDKYPVTNILYLDFVKHNSKWMKSNIKSVFADITYLRNWQNDTILGSKIGENAPVTNISWFSAKAYCECQGKRLPTTNEWEYVSDYSFYKNLNLNDSNFYTMILSWYGKAGTERLADVGSGFENQFGVFDLHGLAFEWVYDFGSTMLSGESRKDGTVDRNAYCASGSQISSNLKDYAAFMRYSIRSSLKSNFTINNLGFRCVKSIK